MESGRSSVRCPPEYIRTVPGILKIVELILCLLTFAISLGGYWSGYGGGWVEFVAMSSFITTLIWFILHLILPTLPGFLLSRPYEFVTYIVMAALFLIAGIVAAARAPYLPGQVGATAFFAFASVVVYGIDAFFQFREWRSAPPPQPAGGTVIVTSSPSEPNPQY
jgi:uncharacterized membrane protein